MWRETPTLRTSEAPRAWLGPERACNAGYPFSSAQEDGALAALPRGTGTHREVLLGPVVLVQVDACPVILLHRITRQQLSGRRRVL